MNQRGKGGSVPVFSSYGMLVNENSICYSGSLPSLVVRLMIAVKDYYNSSLGYRLAR